VTVQAAHPEQGPIAEHITADAVLAPLAQAAIEPKISAPVRKFYVQRGSRVKAGQLLATLENNDLAAAAMDNKGILHGGRSSLCHGRPRRRYLKTRSRPSPIWRRPRRILT
jgi:HlyD family secretion protein